MTVLEIYLKALDSAIWELGEALKNVPEEDVWKRAHPRLLSIGELACHVGYGEASSFLGPDFESLFADMTSLHYAVSVEEAPIALSVGAEGLYEEIQRIHAACKATILASEAQSTLSSGPELDFGARNPYRDGWTWAGTLEYQAFHVAYHAGQIYCVRHLLGHETPDN